MPMCFLAARLWLEFVAKPETLATIHRAFRPNRLAISLTSWSHVVFFPSGDWLHYKELHTIAVACKTLSQLSSFLKWFWLKSHEISWFLEVLCLQHCCTNVAIFCTTFANFGSFYSTMLLSEGTIEACLASWESTWQIFRATLIHL